jgi:hypothetical protein
LINKLTKFKQALSERASGADKATKNSDVEKNSETKKTKRTDAENIANASGPKLDDVNIKFEGDPENQVIVFDLDETLIAGDKNPIDKKREKEINAKGDRTVETVPKDHPLNKRGEAIKYVRRPGTEELLEYLHSRGYKMIACTRNYTDRGESICDHDPVLKKYISGVLGRTDLHSGLNKDFKKYPHHPDNLGAWKKFKGFMHTAFVYTPKHLWLKFKSIFNGKNIRFNPEVGKLGKYPNNMLDLLAAKGNTKLKGLKPPRILVDNSDRRETRDMKQSGNWAYINSNVDKNGDGKETAFFATDDVPKVNLKDPDGKEVEGYEWVKKVIQDIEKGWKEVYKEQVGKEPVLDEL